MCNNASPFTGTCNDFFWWFLEYQEGGGRIKPLWSVQSVLDDCCSVPLLQIPQSRKRSFTWYGSHWHGQQQNVEDFANVRVIIRVNQNESNEQVGWLVFKILTEHTPAVDFLLKSCILGQVDTTSQRLSQFLLVSLFQYSVNGCVYSLFFFPLILPRQLPQWMLRLCRQINTIDQFQARLGSITLPVLRYPRCKYVNSVFNCIYDLLLTVQKGHARRVNTQYRVFSRREEEEDDFCLDNPFA